MNKQQELFEKYPGWIILTTSLVALINYAAGFYILFQTGLIWGICFIIYIIYLELSLYKDGCASCYYYGKTCAFGRGKIASLLFKKDDPEKFCQKEISWKTMIPQILLSLVPIIVGVLLLIKDFDWITLLVMLTPVVLWIFGNPVIYGKLACSHCKQKNICCPVCEHFKPKKKEK